MYNPSCVSYRSKLILISGVVIIVAVGPVEILCCSLLGIGRGLAIAASVWLPVCCGLLPICSLLIIPTGGLLINRTRDLLSVAARSLLTVSTYSILSICVGFLLSIDGCCRLLCLLYQVNLSGLCLKLCLGLRVLIGWVSLRLHLSVILSIRIRICVGC